VQRSCQGSQTAAGRQCATRAQTLTARTPWYVEGNSKPAPQLQCIRAQQAKRAGVRDGSPKGRDAIGGSMHSTTARPGLPGDAHKSVESAMRLCSKPQKHETTFTRLRKPTEPYIRKSGITPIHESSFTYLRQVVHPQTHKSANQQISKTVSNVKRPAHTAGNSLTGVRNTPRRRAGRQGDVQSPLLRDQIRLCVPSSASTSRA
jgi:hypothetical protein